MYQINLYCTIAQFFVVVVVVVKIQKSIHPDWIVHDDEASISTFILERIYCVCVCNVTMISSIISGLGFHTTTSFICHILIVHIIEWFDDDDDGHPVINIYIIIYKTHSTDIHPLCCVERCVCIHTPCHIQQLSKIKKLLYIWLKWMNWKECKWNDRNY